MLYTIRVTVIRMLLAFLFFSQLELIHAQTSNSLKINIFAPENGCGLEVHKKILKKALEELGHDVREKDWKGAVKKNKEPKVDINIFCEFIDERWFNCAKENWFISDPEWYIQDISALERIDLVVCFTHEAERIFQALGKKTYYTGFTSFDCYDSNVKKDFSSFFHLAGASSMKGTHAIIDTWKNNPIFPRIIIIKHNDPQPLKQNNFRWIDKRIPVDLLRNFQNHNAIHLCPSETEGFGHYIMEGMSTGAVIITTDAPPMNEFITDSRCLVPYDHSGQHSLATRYYIRSDQLETTLQNIMALPIDELKKIGEHNRAAYLQKTEEFRKNFKNLMETETRSLSN